MDGDRARRWTAWGLWGILGLFGLRVPGVARAEPVRLVVLHVNDLHGYGFPREFAGSQLPAEHQGKELGSLFSAATHVQRWRDELFAGDPALAERFRRTGDDGILFLDGGDTWSGTLDDFESRGGNVVSLMASPHLDVDASAVGNHSWDFGPARWEDLATATIGHHPLLAANLRRTDGTRPPHVQDHMTLEVRGVRIAIIGLIAANALHSALPEHTRGLKILDPLACFRELRQELNQLPEAQRPDLVMILSHVAFERGGRGPAGPVDYFQELAAMDDEQPGDDRRTDLNVDLIVDAHSHLDHEIRVDGNTWLVQADHYGVRMGEVILSWDPESRKLTGAPSIRRIPLLAEALPPKSEMLEEHAGAVTAARSTNERPLLAARPGLRVPDLLRSDTRSLANPSGDLFTRALLEVARSQHSGGVQGAFVNQTGVRSGLYASRAGTITAGAVHAVSPFANKLAIARVRASDLEGVLRRGLQHRSKLSWAGLEVVARQEGTGPGAEQRRKLVSARLVEAGQAPRSLGTLGDRELTIVAPEFVMGRELKDVIVEGSRIDLELDDRSALTRFLVDLGQRHPALDTAILESIIGHPVTLLIE